MKLVRKFPEKQPHGREKFQHLSSANHTSFQRKNVTKFDPKCFRCKLITSNLNRTTQLEWGCSCSDLINITGKWSKEQGIPVQSIGAQMSLLSQSIQCIALKHTTMRLLLKWISVTMPCTLMTWNISRSKHIWSRKCEKKTLIKRSKPLVNFHESMHENVWMTQISTQKSWICLQFCF